MPLKKSTYTIFTLGSFSFVTALSGSSVTLALPKIAQTFNISSMAATQALQIGLITSIIFLVLFGHAGDVFSKNLVFRYGGWIFTLGTLLTGLAPSFNILLLSRVIQAIGISMISANVMGIITDYFSDDERSKVLAYNSMFLSVGAISGPAVGGVITSLLSWRWVFLIFVPLSFFVTLLSSRILPTPHLELAAVKKNIINNNWLGQIIFTIGIITIFMSQFIKLPYFNELTNYFIWLILGTLITIISFFQDDFSKRPWISPKILRNIGFMGSTIVLFFMTFVNSMSNILLPFYFQNFLGFTAGKSGLLIAVQSLTVMILSPFIGRIAVGNKRRMILVAVGMSILTISQIGYAFYDGQASLFLILVPIILNGLGMGLAMTPNNALTMSFVPSELAGVGGSMNSLFRTIGTALGTSFATSLLYSRLPGVQTITHSLGTSYLSANSYVFFWASFLTLIAFVINFLRPKQAN